MSIVRIYCLILGIINCNAYNASNLQESFQNPLNRHSRQADKGSCQIPPNSLNGEYAIRGDNERIFKEGDYIREFLSVLYIICRDKYKPSPPELIGSLCVNGSWEPPPVTCSPTCKSLHSSETTKVQCSFMNRLLETCDDPVEDTVAKYSCEALYEEPTIEINPYRFCKGGEWNARPQCFPMCGQNHPSGRINVINGTSVKIGNYPWHVGIYSASRLYKCGGSVISLRIILSAAHCFANIGDGEAFPKEDFLIAAGKYYREYNDPRDTYAQYPMIEDIRIPSHYKGSKLQHEADIAVVILKRPLLLSEAVQPVCVDWADAFENQQLTPNSTGIVTGWGYTKEGLELSQELKELTVPFVPFDICFNSVPKSFKQFLRQDKICGGYLDIGTSVCEGDSGGGLVFARRRTGRYFIRGIVSTSPATAEGQCDSNQYGLYTLISKHLEFLNNVYLNNQDESTSTETLPLTSTSTSRSTTSFQNVKLRMGPALNIKPGSCKIPSPPANGVYDIRKSSKEPSEASDGYLAPYGALLTNCDTNYQPYPTDGQVSFCFNGTWNPEPSTCHRPTCSGLESSKTTKVKCKYHGRPLQNCLSPFEGTIAELSCEPFYEEPGIKHNPSRVCEKGAWDYKVNQCSPTCGVGKINVTDQTNLELGDFPWHVGIYDVKQQYLCGGALLSERLILSAAHCFSDYGAKLTPKENFLIATGKLYRRYDDSRDIQAQYSTISRIFLHQWYEGSTTNFNSDTAIVWLEKPFRFSEYVQPVCIDDGNEFEFKPDVYGIITGWGETKACEQSSDELQKVTVPFLRINQCIKEFPKYVTAFDGRICTGASRDGESPGKGFNGGPLVFLSNKYNRYYVKGVFSLFPTSKGCVSNKYNAIYTSISKAAILRHSRN